MVKMCKNMTSMNFVRVAGEKYPVSWRYIT